MVNGDALIVRVAGEVNKNIAVGELKKIVVPLLKDVIYGFIFFRLRIRLGRVLMMGRFRFSFRVRLRLLSLWSD